MIDRRAFCLAAAGPALLTPTLSRTTEDPILPHYRAWLAAREDWRRASMVPGNEDFDSPESLDADEREFAAEDRMLDTVPTSKEGLAAVAHLMWVHLGPAALKGSENYEDQFNALPARMARAIWAFATDGAPMPPTTLCEEEALH
ncbi:hypothetical protein [Salipiger sp. PrR003]|uniref:hypothetical protein n=1 Tax=Salipiger sp. PrR003 TaxID=2706776 RepID=UPI0013DBDA98|nr:hypothetical protein [Salipiger sp. PrR003]NDV52154.1 hypothetical protein [Salipiger sp. PrR003]NDV52180.1 hypothetical protein [Salipiger sp. PrR003]